MSLRIEDLNDIKDRRILYEKKLPAFGYILVLVVSTLLIGVLIWSMITSKTYVVKSSGFVESKNKNYIMSSFAGEISDMNVQNGAYVTCGEVLFTVKSVDLDLQEIQLKGKIEIYEKQIYQLQKLEKSIIDDVNYFNVASPEDVQYYNQFNTYKEQIVQNSLNVALYKQYDYSDSQIETELRKNEGKISEIYFSTLKTIAESINAAKAETENLRVQGNAVSTGQSEYQITATTSGIIYMPADYKEGMVIQAGAVLGSIATENDSYKIKVYINANDMPRVEVGNPVDIAVSGLMESIYGTIQGKVTYIDSDITSSQNSNQGNANEDGGSYFRLEIEPDSNYLVSKSGRKFNLSNGTIVEARIKYDEVTYFGYLMESLGVLVR